jgi:Protein of unknown function (DUF4058)
MPLLDHFHPPLSTQRHWESFHTTWAAAIADSLNQDWLPQGYFAEEQLHPAARIEIDVATFESGDSPNLGGVAVAGPRTYSPTAPTWTVPNVTIEGHELLVFSSEGGPTLVGAVELISPANKDRPESRRAFATKCASYLHQGIGLAIVDVVTSRSANLHNELIGLIDHGGEFRLPDAAQLYAVAYRPLKRGDSDQIDIWPHTLTLGKTIPELPLWIGPELVVPINLEATYTNACRRRRLP